jgi:hypothetical protein
MWTLLQSLIWHFVPRHVLLQILSDFGFIVAELLLEDSVEDSSSDSSVDDSAEES